MNLPVGESVRLVNPRRHPSSAWRWLLLILPALGSLFFAINPLDVPRLLRPLLDLSHVPIFAFGMGMVSRWVGPIARLDVRQQLLLLCGLAAALGGGIELLQPLAGRNASFDDVIYDIAGAAIGVLFCSRRRRELTWHWRRGLQIAVFGVIFLAGQRAATWYIAYSDAIASFPTLGDFELPYSERLWPRSERTEALSNEGSYSLRLDFPAQGWSAVTFEPPRGDWSGYSHLHLSLFSPFPEPLTISLLVADRSVPDRMGNQRPFFRRNFVLEPGWNELSVPILDIANGDRAAIDISDVGQFVLEIPQPKGSVSLLLDAFRLEREEP